MIKIRVLKLGTVCKDKATGLEGTATHWVCDMGKKVEYLFQPKGLNPEDGQPVHKLILEEERLSFRPLDIEEIEIPFEILGTQVTDSASGFSGMAVRFIRHINGCFHVSVQPAGVLKKTRTPIKSSEFDLRECSGKMIKKMDNKQLAASKKKHPSPTGDSFAKPMPQI
ncbi:MAG: hypothetical protein WCO48_01535 [Candidatus Taylorbacteria bacterium]